MKELILGLDAFDPVLFEQLYEQGRVPHLSKYVAAGAYRRLAVAAPPQSEVSWTSIATGLDPGGHGIFDFVHRNPETYAVNVSLLPTESGLFGTRFVPPHRSYTIFEYAVDQGYPATTLWWPATFPARMQSPVQTIPGLGTPDILGRLGVGALFTSGAGQDDRGGKVPVRPLKNVGQGRYAGALQGPLRKKLTATESSEALFELERTGAETAQLRVGEALLDLECGRWSRIIDVSFKVGFLFSVKAITRFMLTALEPEIKLYALPLQIHPLHSPWHYGTPPRFVKNTWREGGPFLTLGWPQDTTALEEECIDDGHFLALCESILERRVQILLHHLSDFREGVLACVFDTLDRVQHMFLRDRPDLVAEWYVKLDGVVGRVERLLGERGLKEDVGLLIVSDHGFTRFDHKVHLNRWLMDYGYLVSEVEAASGEKGQIDWTRTSAYAVGLNSVYLNMLGREGRGIVAPEERETLVLTLCSELEAWQGPDGQSVVARAIPQVEAFDGPLREYGPDILVGYTPGYRASQETGLGGWGEASLVSNQDHWGADHCVDAEAVPGVIFASHDRLQNYSYPSYLDIPAITVGTELNGGRAKPPPTNDEDEKATEERLKGLGYL